MTRMPDYDYEVYSIRDEAVGVFGVPMIFSTDVEALRSFHRICQDRESWIYHSPEDFALFHIGHWDEQEAKLVSTTPRRIAGALHFRSKVNGENALDDETRLLRDSESGDTEE